VTLFEWLCVSAFCAVVLILILVRCWFLAPTRLGWLFYFPNLVHDYVWRRWGRPRVLVDVALALVAVASAGACHAAGAIVLAVLGGFLVLTLELVGRVQERHIALASWALPTPRCPVGTTADSPAVRGSVPSPSWHPLLTANLEGPFVSRMPHYDLGTLVPGRRVSLKVIVANHSTVPAQLPVALVCTVDKGLRVEGAQNAEGPVLRSGDVWRLVFELLVVEPCKAGQVSIEVRYGRFRRTLRVRFSCAVEARQVATASVSRYPGGRRGAFAWRGDMDHYDTVTFQSMEGLAASLGLAARYRVPQTMFLSSRLTLDTTEIERFYGHFGVDRGQSEAGRFVEWLRENVDFCHRASYPFESSKPFLLELGNHMHLHYGTDAAADEGNGWRRCAAISQGDYPWQGVERGSFAEQRDNALEARRWMEKLFGFTPRSWAMPDSTRDENTPRAVEAAGCEVLSDSDARPLDTVVFQPPPHHPAGSHAVELTKRYPGDPESLTHASMFVYWLHRARRRGIPVIFMCHQHMRQFAGHACTRFTEYVLRHVLTRLNGDLHVNTVYGIGRYWEQVLCPEHKVVEVGLRDGRVTVTNKSGDALEQVPVDVRFKGGGAAAYLVDLPPKAVVQIEVPSNTHSVQVSA